jgi:hypothetical protein
MSINSFNILPKFGEKGIRKVSIAEALKLQKNYFKPSRIKPIPSKIKYWFFRMDNRGFLDGHK